MNDTSEQYQEPLKELDLLRQRVRQIEEALQKSEEQYQLLFEDAIEGIFHTTLDGRFIMINDAMSRMLGYGSIQDAVEKVSDIGSQVYADPGERRALIDRLMRDGRITGYEVTLKRLDGSLIKTILNFRLVDNKSGGPPFIAGFCIDITDRWLAEKAFKDSEGKYRQIFENATEGIYQTNPEGRCLRMNPAFSRMFGYASPQEMISSVTNIGRQLYVNPEDRKEMVRRLSEHDEVTGYEAEVYRKDGSRFWISLNIHTVRDDAGNILYFEGTNVDITERKQAAEETLNNANRVQRQNNAIISLAMDETIATGDMPRIFSLLTKTASEAIEVDRASIWLLSEDGENLCCADLYQAGAKTHTQGATLKRKDYPNYLAAIRNTRRIIASDARQDPKTMEFRDGYLVPLGITSMLDVGIYLAGKLAGVVCFEHIGAKREWHADEEAFGNAVAALAAQTLVNMERKRAEEALADAIARRRILVEQSRDGIVVLDWDGRVVETNKCFAQMLGYSPEEVLQLHVWDWDETFPRERLLEMVRSVDEKGDHFETRHRRKDGSFVNVEISANGAMFGQQKMVLYVCRDITERKLAEDELQKLASVVMNSSELVNLSTLDGKMIYLNDAGTRMLGISADELAGKHILDVIPESLVEKVRTEVLPTMKAGVRWEGDLEYKNLKTGALTPVHAIIFLVSDSKTGAPLYFANVSMDITKRKRAEEALRNSETSLAAAQAIAHIGSWEYDIVTQAATLSDELFRIFGFDPALGAPRLTEFFNIVHPDDRERIQNNRSRGIAEKRPYSDEYRIVRPDGSIRWIEAHGNPRFDNVGNLVKDMGAAQDITERKLADLALRETEARYRLLFDKSPDSILIVDPETGRFLDFNETACRLLGYSREEFAQLTLTDFLMDEKPEDIRRRQEKIMLEKWGDIECRGRTRQGEIKNLLVTVQVTEISGRKVFYSVIRDITERRKLEGQLRQAQKIEGLGHLAGGIAHDFNNVLNVVMGLTELSILDMAEDDPARVHAEEVLQAVTRGAELTKQILAFSRQQALEIKPININNTIKDLQKMLRRLVREDITINLKLSDEDLTVMADKAQIDQVLMNLSTNAGDAMPNGGNIDISTSSFVMDERFAATHGYGGLGNYAHITFSDTGCGMDAGTIANIFDPFFTTKERGKGTGLGLAVVHGILKQHNGHINVYSEPGKGTVFNLYLPLTGAKVEKTAVPSPEKPRGGTETLLVAEDDDLVRDVSVKTLASLGYKIIQAIDGKDAIDKFAESGDSVSLVILDGIMPKKMAWRCLRP